ncbi:protein kinase domain-containing protein [Streptomyces parvus]
MSSPLTQDDPERVGGYWLAARLGAGGQGVVYEAYDASGDRFALKTLHRAADPFLRERFTREAEAARRVAPFCTARIVRAGVDGEVPYLVSEYVPGPALATAVRENGPSSPDAVLRLATGVATALAAIHQAGVVHRDLKPGNVLLGPDGPRIIDFGIARAPDMSLTATGAIMGTFGYMAPEVLAGQRATEASDVFAWAAVVLYAATGTEPFRGENIAEVAHRTTTVEPDLGALPPEIRPLMAAALAKDPALRPTAADLLLGLVGAPVKAADPRAALMEAGARKAAAPQGDDAPAADGPEPTGTDRSDGETGVGGTVVEAPLGERAEAAFAALSPAARLAAHGLLLRLTVPGAAPDGSQDSVRTAHPDELLADRPEDEQQEVTAAAQRLLAAGVLVADADDGTLRPASAALLPAWRRLHAWIDADRPGLAVLQRIGSAARLWQRHGERPEDLLRGTELTRCLDWLPTAPYSLRPNPLEQRFLTASRAAAARTTRRRRQLLSGLAGATALALLAGGLAWAQSREADRRRAEATARTVAQAAANLPATEPETAMLLGLASWRIAEVPEARAALAAAAVQPVRSVVDLSDVNDGEEQSSHLSRDGRRLIASSSLGVRIHDLTGGQAAVKKPVATLSPDEFELDDTRRPAFSPDGRLMLLVAKDKTFRVMNTEDGTPAAPPVRAPSGYFEGLAVSNSGHMLLSDRRSITLVDREGNGLAAPTGGTLTPDGKYSADCVEGEIRVVGLLPGEDPVIRETLPYKAGSCDFEFSPDGRYMSVSTGSSASLYDLVTHKKTGWTRHQGDDIRFGSQGRFLVGWGNGGTTIGVWAHGSQEPLFTVTAPTGQGDKGFYADQLALDEKAERLRYFSTTTGRLYEIDLTGALSGRADDDGVTAAVSAGGRFALVRSATAVEQPQLQAVDLRTGKPVGGLVAQRQVGDPLENEELYASIDDEGRVVAYSYKERVSRYESDHEVVVRDVRKGKDLHRVPVAANHRPLHLAVSPDGRHLSVVSMEFGVESSGAHVHEVWDIEKRKKMRQFNDSTAEAVFSHDSERLVTASGMEVALADGALRRTGLARDPGGRPAFSPDGRYLAVLRGSGWLELWDGAARERKAVLPSELVPGAPRFGQPLGDLAFSDDGGLLAVVVRGEAVQLWDTNTRTPLGKPLPITGRRVDSLTFDGTVLRTVTGSAVHRLDLSPDRLAEQVCRRAGRDITPEEWRTYVPDAPYRNLC